MLRDPSSQLDYLITNDGIKALYQLRAYDISCRFPIKLLTHFALKKDFLLDNQTFHLISGAFS